jgi:hypothetical protein
VPGWKSTGWRAQLGRGAGGRRDTSEEHSTSICAPALLLAAGGSHCHNQGAPMKWAMGRYAAILLPAIKVPASIKGDE